MHQEAFANGGQTTLEKHDNPRVAVLFPNCLPCSSINCWSGAAELQVQLLQVQVQLLQ